MMIPCQLSTISEFISSAFQFRVILAQNKSWNAWKIANEVRKGLKSDDVALNGACWMQKKSWIKICLKKLKSFCNRRVFVQNPDTLKEIVQFVHEVHPVFPIIHSIFYHMVCGWNYETMPSFNIFRIHCQCLSISESFRPK